MNSGFSKFQACNIKLKEEEGNVFGVEMSLELENHEDGKNKWRNFLRGEAEDWKVKEEFTSAKKSKVK